MQKLLHANCSIESRHRKCEIQYHRIIIISRSANLLVMLSYIKCVCERQSGPEATSGELTTHSLQLHHAHNFL